MMLPGFDWQTDGCTVCILDIITAAPGLIDTSTLSALPHIHMSRRVEQESKFSLSHRTRNPKELESHGSLILDTSLKRYTVKARSHQEI